MCSSQEWTPEARAVTSGAKRRLREIQRRQVASVCLGIEHLINKRRRAAAGAAGGAARVSPPAGQQPRLRHDTARDTACDPHASHHHRSHHHRASSCRLCYSTLRVLSIARAHGKRCRHRQHQQQQQQQQHRYQSHVGGIRSTSSRLASCEACRMWSMVAARCASLGIPLPGDVFASVGGGGDLRLPGNGVDATAAAATAAAGSALSDAGPVVRVDTVANE